MGPRLAALVPAAAVAAAAVASSASAALFFLFSPTSAKPGDSVTVRLGGTPPAFTLADRERPFQRPIRVYLVSNQVAPDVRTRFDPRLRFVGLLVPDRNTRGLLAFRVPPLDTGTYAVAAWCPACARTSFGRAFFVLGLPEVSRYRRQLALRVQMPDPTASCPASEPNLGSRGDGFVYGNGLLTATLPPDGVVVAARYEPDGSLFWKPGWRRPGGLAGTLTVQGERIDAPAPPMRVLAVRFGSGGSWRTAATFPSEGCWRITGRVDDVALSYVVRVIAG